MRTYFTPSVSRLAQSLGLTDVASVQIGLPIAIALLDLLAHSG